MGYKLKILIVFLGQLELGVRSWANQLQCHIKQTWLKGVTFVGRGSQGRTAMSWNDTSKSLYCKHV